MMTSQHSVKEMLLVADKSTQRRARTNRIMRWLVTFAALLAVFPLFVIITFVVVRAAPYLTPELILNNPLDTKPGILNAVVGSIQMTALTMLITSPIGIAGGIYISEFSSPRISAVCDTVLDILLGVPSIIAGLFAYLVLVPVTGFSGLAGSLSLGILTLPIVMRTTREVLRLVPPSIREASLALGIPIWRTTILVTLRTALPGVLTGLVLASSRSLGETAPLIMTAQGTNALNILDFGTTMNAMPLVIFRYARSPDQLQIGQAWAAALILMTIALVMNVIVRRKTVDSRVA